jgi:hypothetical protein
VTAAAVQQRESGGRWLDRRDDGADQQWLLRTNIATLTTGTVLALNVTTLHSDG